MRQNDAINVMPEPVVVAERLPIPDDEFMEIFQDSVRDSNTFMSEHREVYHAKLTRFWETMRKFNEHHAELTRLSTEAQGATLRLLKVQHQTVCKVSTP